MSETAQQIIVVVVFAALLFALNLKAGSTWLKVLTLWGGVAAAGLAGWLIVEWVLL